MTENKARQVEEVQALEAIYGEEWYTIDEVAGKYGITIKDSSDNGTHYIILEVKLSGDYPGKAPPMYELRIPWMSGEKRQQVDNDLSDIYLENIGDSILYMWIEKLREYLLDYIAECAEAAAQEGKCAQKELAAKAGEVEDGTEVYDSAVYTDVQWSPAAESSVVEDRSQELNEIKCPEVFHGEPLHDRKSKFQAHIAEIFYKEQVKMVIDKLCENKKIAAATHNMYAYRIYREEEGKRPLINQGCEDDGEIHAGNRMLHLLQIIDCQNVMVVVTRWYGGIHLGPDRFKHINSLTRNILEEHGYIKDVGKPKDKKSSKKK